MFGLMMFIAKNPEISAKLGLVGTKAKLFGENDWTGYFGLLNQAIATIGLIGFGFVTSWIFGSEYTQRTMKDLLSLPISRTAIVIAKFIVATFWSLLLVAIFFIVALVAGKIQYLDGWDPQTVRSLSVRFFQTAFLTLLLSTPVGFIAGYGRGIIAPLGFVIITIIVAQFTGLSGLGPYFPWSIPGIYSVSGSATGLYLVPASYFIILLTSLAGLAGTILFWRNSDHH
jgi:ABC-2 type transport system permease protein